MENLHVFNFIGDKQVALDVDRSEVERRKPEVATMFTSHGMNAHYELGDGRKLASAYQRRGSSGWAIWVLGNRPIATSVLLAGVDDEKDERVLQDARAMTGPGSVSDAMDGVRNYPRPLIATFAGPRDTFEKLPLAQSAVALAESVLAKVGVSSAAEPLGKQPAKMPRAFTVCHVVSANAGPAIPHSYDQIMDIGDLPPVVSTFIERLIASPDRFEQYVVFRSPPAVRVNFVPLGPTAAIAEFQHEKDGYNETALLLTGIHSEVDRHVLGAAMTNAPSESRISDTPTEPLQQIGKMPRPLVVVKGTRGFPEREVVIEMIEWSLAAAFFRLRGVA